MKAYAMTAAAALTLACACVGCRQADKPVPRREAHARIETYKHEYVPVGADTLPIKVNAALEADVAVSRHSNSAWWITIKYPRYNAGIYVTIMHVPADSMPMRMAQRMERLSLDMGSATYRLDEWQHGAYYGITATAPWQLSTPIKLIAHDDTYLVSATAVCDGYTDSDELAPVLDALNTDMSQLLTAHGNNQD